MPNNYQTYIQTVQQKVPEFLRATITAVLTTSELSIAFHGSEVWELLDHEVFSRQWGSALQESRANPNPQTPASQNQGAATGNSPWSFLPQWPTRLISWQIWVTKKHLAIGNVSREVLTGRRGEPLPQSTDSAEWQMSNFYPLARSWEKWNPLH